MSVRRTQALAWSLYVVALGAIVVAVWLGVLNGSVREDVLFVVLGVLMVLANGSLGTLLAVRRPRNPIGWLHLAFATTLTAAILGEEYATFAVATSPGSLPGARFALWAAQVPPPLFGAAVTLVFLLFPTGRVPSPRWRPLLWGTVIASGLATVGLAVNPTVLSAGGGVRAPNPFGIAALGSLPATVSTVAGFAMVAAGVASIASVFVRYRRAGTEERQQIRWLAYVSAAAIVMLVGLLLDTSGPVGDFFWAGMWAVIALGVPGASAIAILKYRLYELDIVVKKTVVFGVLAAFISAVYVGIVVGIGALVGSRENLLLSIVATALIALAFQPARASARRLADRVVYGKRATPYEVLAEFSERMSATYSADEILPRMAQILHEGTGAARAEVWLRVGQQLRDVASVPEAGSRSSPLRLSGDELPEIPGGDRAFAVRHRGDLLGALTVSMPPTEPLTPANEKLIGDLAAQAGLVLRNVRLIEELRASRERLVAAQDEERRRIERNIHDGAQQQLVALAVNLKLARTLTAKDPDKAQQILERLQSDTQTALEDLRDLARGIYPPLLADKGLSAALEAQARKAPFPVTVQPNGIGRYPQEVEAAIYFCVLEALQNAAKYAEASRAVVSLRRDDREVIFEVSDDGRGFDPRTARRGAGLQNMADRLEALGGSLQVRSGPRQGTLVSGRVPVA